MLNKHHPIYLIYSLSKILFAGCILLFASCQEPYLNADLEANEKIPVFSGSLSNQNYLNNFELYWAMPYTNQRINRIAGAQINIYDQNNNAIKIDEIADGYYKLSDENLVLKAGNSYTADILLDDGSHIKSQPVNYLDTLTILSTFFDFNIKSSIEKNTVGEYITVSKEGLFIYLKMEQPKSEKVFYRANADYYVHSEKWVNSSTELIENYPGYTLIYEIRSDTLYDVLEGYTNTDFPIIGELDPNVAYNVSDLTLSPIFLIADRECRNFKRYTNNTFIQWIIPIDLYHTSKTSFNYYNDALKQLEATGQIFDPIPDQILGNMFMQSNSNEVALGLFDAFSVNRKYMGIYVHESLGYRSYRSRTFNDTIIKQGMYPKQYWVDTVLVDSIPAFLN